MSEDALVNAVSGIRDSDVDQVVLRQLKHWCLTGHVAPDRRDHMDPTLFPRFAQLDVLPSSEALEAELGRLAKRARTA
jgi:hypothetical protein